MKRQDHEYLEIAEALKALAHPIRIAIAELLNEKKRLNVTEIHQQLGLRQAEVSTHLARLRKYKLVKTERKEVVVYYMLNNRFVSDLMDFMGSTYLK